LLEAITEFILGKTGRASKDLNLPINNRRKNYPSGDETSINNRKIRMEGGADPT